jgi:Cu/Ag efflux protein CusF
MSNFANFRVTLSTSKTLLAICTGLILLWPTLGSNPVNAQTKMKTDMQMEMAKEGVFQGKGKIVAVVPTKGQVVLDHEEIKGFMGAMTMGYSVASQELMKGFKPGDSVNFRIDAAKKQIIAIEQQGN